MPESINTVTGLVASIVYNADKNVRDELFQGIVVDENDYVSNLTGKIRNEWGKNYNLPCYLHSQKLDRSKERFFGCDAFIIFKIDDIVKLCLFEAKFPRIFSRKDHSWDSFQSSSGISHFSDQLRRQSRWSHVASIWEFFILEQKPGKRFTAFDQWGSTCVWHTPTLEYDHIDRRSNILWDNTQLKELLCKIKARPNLKEKNLFQILMPVLSCKLGARIPIRDDFISIESSDRNIQLSVPTALKNMDSHIPEFCQEYGVKYFWYLELNQNTIAKMR